jgi:hypothetical protein
LSIYIFSGYIPSLFPPLPSNEYFFYRLENAALPLILGENYTVYLQKGKKKTLCKLNFWENCMILKNISVGKQPYNSPWYRRKKTPNSWCLCVCISIIFILKCRETFHYLYLNNVNTMKLLYVLSMSEVNVICFKIQNVHCSFKTSSLY